MRGPTSSDPGAIAPWPSCASARRRRVAAGGGAELSALAQHRGDSRGALGLDARERAADHRVAVRRQHRRLRERELVVVALEHPGEDERGVVLVVLRQREAHAPRPVELVGQRRFRIGGRRVLRGRRRLGRPHAAQEEPVRLREHLERSVR
ncbi:MAG: hypothetical protein AAFP86_06655, partial [Planctomycetota bacterium]